MEERTPNVRATPKQGASRSSINYLIRIQIILVVSVSIFSCTSIPSMFKLNGSQDYSLGVDVQFNYFNKQLLPTVSLDGRRRLNDVFDVGITLTPGLTINTLAPYVLGTMKIGNNAEIISFLQLPTRINLNALVFNTGNEPDPLEKIRFETGINSGMNFFYQISGGQQLAIGARIDTTRFWVTKTAENIFGEAGSPYLLNAAYVASPFENSILTSYLEADPRLNVDVGTGIFFTGR